MGKVIGLKAKGTDAPEIQLSRPGRNGCRAQKSIFAGLAFFMGVSVCVLFRETFFPVRYQYYHLADSFSNKTNQSSCVIPSLDPWDPSIRRLLPKSTPSVNCKLKVQEQYTVFDPDGGILKLTELAKSAKGVCKFRCFDRKSGADSLKNLYHGSWTTFFDSIQPGCEFFEVKCARKNVSYHNVYNQIIPKKRSKLSTPDRPSIVLFVIDSVSHSSFRRDLSATYDILTKELDAQILNGYVKTGENSFPNAIAFLTGRMAETAEIRPKKKTEQFDSWPLIWKDFAKRGYVTYYSEDQPRWHLFSYLAAGFKNKPVDHYARPFYLKLFDSPVKSKSRHLCFSEVPTLSGKNLGYLQQFLKNYGPKRPKFALHWIVEASHGKPQWLAASDLQFAEFFRGIKPLINNTVIFVVSDHGHRFHTIRQTLVGRIEERMPFFSVIIPKSLPRRTEILEALQWNSKVLTTPFDLYMAMQDILISSDKPPTGNLAIFDEKLWRSVAPHGLSLFRKIPSRDCRAAGIPEQFCVCEQSESINTTNSEVKSAAKEIVRHINLQLKRFDGKCVLLTMNTILHAQVKMPNIRVVEPNSSVSLQEIENSSKFFVLYTVALTVKPSEAVFEGTVRLYVAKNKMEVVGQVERINEYGNQSACIDSRTLRQYCYCT